MDNELKKELEEIHSLAKDNHRMLRAIRRDQWFGFIGKLIFWAIAFALPLYFYQQYLQPLVSKFSASSGMSISGPFGLPTFTELQKLLKSPKGKQ